MNIHFETTANQKVEVELHFADGKKYGFEVSCHAHSTTVHTVVGRWRADISRLLVKVDDYWYDEPVNMPVYDVMTIKLDGREKYTQMLRDAAMRVKP
jgi:hypothetical protein